MPGRNLAKKSRQQIDLADADGMKPETGLDVVALHRRRSQQLLGEPLPVFPLANRRPD
jgi:hypothetical protein